jgi:hypothetical protein
MFVVIVYSFRSLLSFSTNVTFSFSAKKQARAAATIRSRNIFCGMRKSSQAV